MENGMGDIIASLVRNTGDNNGFGCNGGGIWVILLFFLLCGGNYGWGGNRFGNYATQQDVSMGFATQDLNNAVRGNGAAINQLGVQSMGQANNIQQAINQLGDWMQAGFANTNHNIDNLKFAMAEQTNAITANATANTQRILDKLCASETAQLRSDLQAAQLTLSNAAQTQTIISALKTTT